ncbi:MAG: hypothetical protein AUJ28_00730 [Parcubacteria group bacterium CG1_02_37_51]|nr:MAG: hypothetical protein AUJ28_00730 [Parcubacteria group bacterium CG1_02_37_51]
MLSRAQIIDGPNRVKPSFLKRTTIVLASILAILVIVAGAYYFFSNQTKTSTPFAGLESKVTRIEIQQMDTTNVLAKQGDLWVVTSSNDVLANQVYFNDIWQALDQLNVTEVASTNPANQADLQVDGSGLVVQLFAGDEVSSHFYIGRNGPGTMPSSYLRFEGENKVYLVDILLTRLFGYLEWRDLIVSQIDSETINELKWNDGLHLAKEEDGWKMLAPEEKVIDEAQLTELLVSLGDLKAIDIAEIKMVDLDAESSSFAIEVKTSNDDLWRFAFWQHDLDSGDYDYYAIREGSDTVYVMSKYIGSPSISVIV